MTAPILQTKLFAPRPRRTLVSRPRLTRLLDRGAEAKLTLVSAPPGFGKTTLLAAWAASPELTSRAAWLTLDAGDNHVGAFWGYVIAALQAAEPGIGGDALALLDSPQPSIEAALATLLNDLAALPNEVVLVLDDYHAIEAPEIHDSIAYLLEHLPPQVHLVIATRADVPLPLAGMRARGDLVEIRAAELRFTPDEAAAYLNDAMGLSLAADDVATLERRTEGWIAALQLAALSIHGREDVAGFIAGFAGDDHYLVDYLVEEVLRRQPERVRAFLLDTAILTRLSGPLCDAVTGQIDGKATLEALDRANLFLVPLDDRRQWYRYHHLFADLLRARLLDERPDQIAELHRRASAWFERDGRPARGDPPRAGGGGRRTRRRPDRACHPRRAEQPPGICDGGVAGRAPGQGRSRGARCSAFTSRACACCAAGLTTLSRGCAMRSARSNRRRQIRPSSTRPRSGVFRPRSRSIAQRWRRSTGTCPATVAQARRALERLGRGRPHGARRGKRRFSRWPSWRSGDLDDATGYWTDTLASLERAGYRSDAIGTAMSLGDVRTAQGRLRDALRAYEHGLRIASVLTRATDSGHGRYARRHQRGPPRAE